jgi:hypothetical protein
LGGLSGLVEGSGDKQDTNGGHYQHPERPERHRLLRLKIALGAPFIPIGFWTSVLALRRWAKRSDPLGFLIFLSGDAIGAVFLAIMIA